MTYAEALQEELKETEQETQSYLDSEGNQLSVGDRVYLSEQAEGGWNSENQNYNSRDFDFGRVESVNQDGTVNVSWDAAMCGCMSENPSLVENTADLTKTSTDAVYLYYKGLQDGEDEGRKTFQREFRNLLGLPDSTE